jgi:hypothetical protein
VEIGEGEAPAEPTHAAIVLNVANAAQQGLRPPGNDETAEDSLPSAVSFFSFDALLL